MTAEHQNMVAQLRGTVETKWLYRGAWLSRAWERFGGRWAQETKVAQSRFAELRHGETPEAFAYLWEQRNQTIDFEGRSLEEFIWSTPPFPPRSHYNEIGQSLPRDVQPPWFDYGVKRYLAEAHILVGLLDGSLCAYGSRDHTASEPTWIPTRAWQDLKRDRAQRDRAYADGVLFYHVHVVRPLEIAAAAAPTSERDDAATAGAVKRGTKRGPKPEILPQVVAAMRAEITAGIITADGLSKMLEKELASRHAVSRDTARKARNIVLGPN